MAERDPEIEAFLAKQNQEKDPDIEAFLAKQDAETAVPNIINEPADIPWQQRAAVKNFGGSVDEQVAYLKSIPGNENLEISSFDNEVIARKKGEQNWKKLDPTGVTSAGEAIQDLLDVGYDVTAGTLSGLATAKSGLLGGVATGGVGAIPAAMAGGAAASAGLEAIRQKIGQRLGAAGETDKRSLILSGALGAASPLLFGVGAGKGQIQSALSQPGAIGKILKKTKLGFVKEAGPTEAQAALAKGVLEQSQKGILGKGTDKLLSMVSGAAPAKTITEAKKELKKPIIDFMAKVVDIDPAEKYTAQEMSEALVKQDKLVGFGDAVAGEIQTKMKSVADELSARYTRALENANASFNVTELGDDLLKEIDLLKNSESKNLKDLGETAQNIYDEFFAGAAETGAPLVLGPAETQRLLGSMKKFIKVAESPLTLDKRGTNQKILSKFVGQATKKLDDDFYGKLAEVPEGKNLRELYKEHKEFFRELYPKFEDTESAVRTINSINNKNKAVLRNTIQQFDTKYMKDSPVKIMDMANLADVAKYFGDPSLEAISSGGATSTGKILSAGELAGTAGWMAAQASGIAGLTPAAAFAGRTIGQTAARPAVIANVMKAQTAARRGMEKLGVPAFQRGLSSLRERLPLSLQPALSGQSLFQTGVNAQVPQTALNSVWQLMGGQ